MGDLVYNEEFVENKLIEFSIEQPAGVYFIEIVSDNNQKTVHRIIIH
jgi:hypothetical protein